MYEYALNLKLTEKLGPQTALLRWKARSCFCKNNLIGVTYANDKHLDGPAAQLQRIYGVYSISRLLGLSYIHSPLIAIEHSEGSHDFLAMCNDVFNIPSDISLPSKYAIYETAHLDLATLERIKKESIRKKTFTLIRATYPYRITDIYPESYRAVKSISPFRFQKSSVVRVAIHVRRGDALYRPKEDRMLPDSYYISVAQELRRIFASLKLDYAFEVYSDGYPNDPEMNKFKCFYSIPNLKISVGSDPMGSLQNMATADVLIISHSSFSYLAGILNTWGVVMYNRFCHSPLDEWVINDDSGSFNKNKFIKQLNSSFSPS